MKTTIFFVALLLSLTSCRSEYEERLDQAKMLKVRLDKISEMRITTGRNDLENELKAIRAEIIFLSKVSGNEEKFLEEIYKD